MEDSINKYRDNWLRKNCIGFFFLLILALNSHIIDTNQLYFIDKIKLFFFTIC